MDWRKSNQKNYVEFARGYVQYKVGKNGYIADVVIGIKKSGAAELYDLTNIYEKEITEASYTDKVKTKSSRSDTSAINHILPQPAQKSNTIEGKKSVDDSIEDRDLVAAVHNLSTAERRCV